MGCLTSASKGPGLAPGFSFQTIVARGSMGWVDDRFKDQLAYQSGVPKLWNKVRDSVGLSVIEFNERTGGTPNVLDRTDCQSQAKYCIRFHKALDNASLEFFLDEGKRSLKTSRDSSITTICVYRLTGDRSEIELFSESLEQVLSVEDACRTALHDFIFTPFPTPFSTSV